MSGLLEMAAELAAYAKEVEYTRLAVKEHRAERFDFHLTLAHNHDEPQWPIKISRELGLEIGKQELARKEARLAELTEALRARAALGAGK